jgi:hypothetical protein
MAFETICSSEPRPATAKTKIAKRGKGKIQHRIPVVNMTVALALPGCAREIRSALHKADRLEGHNKSHQNDFTLP